MTTHTEELRPFIVEARESERRASRLVLLACVVLIVLAKVFVSALTSRFAEEREQLAADNAVFVENFLTVSKQEGLWAKERAEVLADIEGARARIEALEQSQESNP